ncbi:MAG: TSCPD domain-containing protein [Ruminiclostridium sp.]
MDGFTAEKIVAELGGTLCGRRPTSCVDQLSIAVQKAYKSQMAREDK